VRGGVRNSLGCFDQYAELEKGEGCAYLVSPWFADLRTYHRGGRGIILRYHRILRLVVKLCDLGTCLDAVRLSVRSLWFVGWVVAL